MARRDVEDVGRSYFLTTDWYHYSSLDSTHRIFLRANVKHHASNNTDEFTTLL